VLSRAIVPPQEFNPKGATVRIQVIEGWVNKVEWPKKLSRYRDFFSDYATRITTERPANSPRGYSSALAGWRGCAKKHRSR